MKALKVISYVCLIVFVPYVLGLVLNHFMGLVIKDFADIVMIWLGGAIVSLIIVFILALIFGGSNDGGNDDGNSDDGNSTVANMMLINTVTTMNTINNM